MQECKVPLPENTLNIIHDAKQLEFSIFQIAQHGIRVLLEHP